MDWFTAREQFLEKIKEFKKKERLSKRVLSHMREEWRVTHWRPRQGTKKELAQCSAHDFTSQIIPILKRESSASENSLIKYQRRIKWLRILFRTFIALLIFDGFPLEVLSVFGKILYSNPLENGIFFTFTSVFDGYKFSQYIVLISFFVFINRASILMYYVLSIPIVLCHHFFTGETGIISAVILGSFSFLILLSFYIVIKRYADVEKGLDNRFSEMLSSIYQSVIEKIKEMLESLLEWQQRSTEIHAYSRLKYWQGCVSSGGIAATSEQHAFSLFIDHLSSVAPCAFLHRRCSMEA